MARHVRGKVTSHMLSYTNRRHVTSFSLEAAIRDMINAYNRLSLPKCWGSGNRAIFDELRVNRFSCKACGYMMRSQMGSIMVWAAIDPAHPAISIERAGLAPSNHKPVAN